MGIPSKVRIEICGAHYVISTTEEEGYVKKLAEDINLDIQACMEKNAAISQTDALVLVLLSYADQYKKSERNADHIRGQFSEYLEDAARSRNEIEDLKRENEKLRRELSLYKEQE